ncbi:MAG: hypothetical protein B6244_13025 [Candidatus Cloacimonetes bacterium 4572_55]|nr:MAG: hypothetical protein B6244_13025 [Candidatus Cloacimonetes bacterium 4572_55]
MRLITYIFLFVIVCAEIVGSQPFTDVTDQVNLGDLGGGNSAAWGDFNRDGYLDLFIARFGGNRLLQNIDGSFLDVSAQYGVETAQYATKSAMWTDFDSDGDLDILLVNNSGQTRILSNRRNAPFIDVTDITSISHTGFGGKAVTDVDADGDPDIFLTAADGCQFYRNNGNFSFTDVSLDTGIENITLGLSASFADFDQDRLPDLFVGTLLPDRAYFYKNQGGLNFSDITDAADIHSNSSDWACVWADADNDGYLVAYVSREGANSLYHNTENNLFVDIAESAGIAHPANTQAATWGDFDRDGLIDLYIVNSDATNALYRNNGDNTFTDVTQQYQAEGDGISRDATWADYDNDGDLDLFLIREDGYQLLKNNMAQNNWFHVKLTGTLSSSDGVGARIRITSNLGIQARELGSDCGPFGQNSFVAEFGLGDDTTIYSAQVQWLNGETQMISNVTANQIFHFVQPHPNLWVDQEIIDFGDQPVEISTEMEVLVQNPGGNIGGAALSINNIIPTSPQFSVSPENFTLQPNEGEPILLTFTPADTGLVQADLIIQSNDPQGNFLLTLNGYGTAAYIDLPQTTLDFGGSPINEPKRGSLIISNQGNSTLTVTGLSSDQPLFVSGETLPLEIERNSSEAVDLIFTPTDIEPVTATLTITSDDHNGNAPTVELTGYGEAPLLQATSEIDFGFVPIYSDSTRFISLTNIGEVELIVYDIDVDHPAFIDDFSSVLLISPGGNERIPITFQPDQIGAFTASATIQSSDFFGDETTNLIGNGVAAVISATDSVLFVPTALGYGSSAELTIANNGQLDLFVESFLIDHSAFSTESTLPLILLPQSQMTVMLFFNPLYQGEINGNLYIFSNDPDQNSTTVRLKGIGLAAQIAASDHLLNFGSVRVGQTRELSLTISNNGQADLEMEGLSFDNDQFQLTSPGFPLPNVAPNEELTLSVVFQPTEIGDQTGVMSLSCNDPNQTNFDLSLIGVGARAQLTTIPEAVDFGQVYIGRDSTISIRSRNSGSASLTIVELSISDNVQYHTRIDSSPSDLPITLLPNAEIEIELTFQPTIADVNPADLSIFLDDEVGSEEIVTSVVGQGILDVTPPQFLSAAQFPYPIAGNELPVQIRIQDDIAMDNATLSYRLGGNLDYVEVASLPVDSQNSELYQATIPAESVTDRGLEFYISAVDHAGNSAIFPSNENYPEIVRVQVLNLQSTETFPVESYQLFSIPLELDNRSPGFVLSNEFGQYDPTKWRLWEWETDLFLYEEYEPNDPSENRDSFFLEQGQGYWLVAREPQPLDTQPATALSVSTGEPYELTLERGWNIIGSPFSFPVGWSSIDLPDNVENAAWEWDGSAYEQTALLVPWKGYFLRNNNDNRVVIRIPPIAETSPASTAAILDGESYLDGYDWGIQLSVRSEKFEDCDNYALFSSQQSFRLSEPPIPPDNAVQLYFIEDDQKSAVDCRQISNEGHRFSFEICLKSDDPIFVTLSQQAATSSDYEFCITDQTLQYPVEGEYGFWAIPNQPHRFLLVAGAPYFVEEHCLQPQLPQNVALYPNYPNPFTEYTTMNLFLPDASRVTAKIYSVTGQLVRTLCDQEMSPSGFRRLHWDGTLSSGENASSGVYFLDLQTNDFRQCRSMLLIR